MASNRTFFAVGSLVLAMTLATWADARNLYRYRDDNGVLVVDFHVPAEYVDNGYEVLNDAGVVVDVVPRALTSNERQDATLQRRLQQEAADERIRLQQWDESLLLRYSSVEDIEAARDRSLRDLKIRVSILKSNRRSLRQKVENTQARVAEAERAGRQPTAQDLEIIDQLKDEIASTERQIADRQSQIDEVSDGYQRDINRFELLQEVVELRQSLERPE
ncbi:MAG: hypothetical protein RLZZ602_917 [Pseudomonadota bacterium]